MKDERRILKSSRNWTGTETWRALDIHHKKCHRISSLDRDAINDIAKRDHLDSIQAAFQWGYAAAMGNVNDRIVNDLAHMEGKRRMSEIDRPLNDPKARETIFSKASKLVSRP